MNLNLDAYRFPSHLYDGMWPYVDEITAEYNRWCDQMTHLSLEGKEQYKRQKLTHAAARSFPHPASYDRARACALQLFWMTLFDDFHGLSSPAELEVWRARIVGILRGAQVEIEENPFYQKVAELRELCVELMPAQWMERYIVEVNDFILNGVVRENVYRRQRLTPPLAELREFRPYCIALLPYIRMVEVELDFPLPWHIATSPAIKRFEYLLARITVWQNDAFSLPKELPRADTDLAETCNLILVLQKEHALSFEEASLEMERIYKADVAEFLDLWQNMPEFGPHQPDVDNYLHHVALTATGLETWYRIDTARYQPNGWPDEYLATGAQRDLTQLSEPHP